MADDQPAGRDGFLEQALKREGGVEARIVAKAGRGLGDDEIGGEQDVARLAQSEVVVADPWCARSRRQRSAMNAPESRVDDSQARSFGAP